MKSKIIYTLILSFSFLKAAGSIVFDPTTYASILESIEKYNSMIKGLEDQLNTMNRINDVINTASNQLNNLQVGLANPEQLIDRFKSNLEGIEANFNSITNNLKEYDWRNSIIKNQYASCKQRWQKLRNKYKEEYDNNPITKEIDANTRWMDEVNSSGLASANEKINEFFDDIVNKMDITDVEAKLSKKDPKKTTVYICRLIEQEELDKEEKQAINDYHKAVKNKDLQKTKQKMEYIKKIREKKKSNKIDRKKGLLKINKTDKDDKTKEIRKTLIVNKSSCDLEGKWEKYIKSPNKDDLTEIKNFNNQTICLPTKHAINEIYDAGEIIEALNLQNQRNMGLALAGDAYSLSQAQLETLTLISKQIDTLQIGLKNIQAIAEEFLLNDIEARQIELDNFKNSYDSNLYDYFLDMRDYEPSFEYNEFGMPVRKSRSNSKNNTILDK